MDERGTESSEKKKLKSQEWKWRNKMIRELSNMIEQEFMRQKELYAQVEKSLKEAPEEYLRVNYNHGIPQYFVCKEGDRANGTYIKKTDVALIRKLSQKEYDQKVLKHLEKNIKCLQKVLKYLSAYSSENIWDKMHAIKKQWIEPYRLPDKEYREQWENVKYSGKDFWEDATEIYTEKGERVRSKSEKIIADKLYSMGIPYRYEFPLQLKGFGVIYPDFMILNVRKRKEYFLEHFGMMDNPEYASKAVKKIRNYEKNRIFIGDRLLVTFETLESGCDTRQLQELMERFVLQ